MDQSQGELARTLRDLGSREAADWLLDNCPLNSADSGLALKVMQHVSWSKADRMRLARHYLADAPYPNPLPYQAIWTILTEPEFRQVISELEIVDEADRRLHTYHLQSLESKLPPNQ